MYYYEIRQTIRVDKLDDGRYSKRVRETKLKSLPENLIHAIPTEQYKPFLDIILDRPNETLPAVRTKAELPIEVGKDYYLGTKETIYRLEKTIDTEDMSLLIVSVQGGERDPGKVALTEEDCAFLGLEYKENLYPINPSQKLNPYDPDEKEYEENDLSTYPCSIIKEYKNSVRYLILRLGGFKRTSDPSIILTPSGAVLDIELFTISLKVSVKRDISPMAGLAGWMQGEEVSWSPIIEDFKGSEKVREKDLCDINGNIHILVRLIKGDKGISPYSMQGLKPGDVFKVTWDSSFAVSDVQKVEEKISVLSDSPKIDKNIFIQDRADVYWRAVMFDNSGNQKYIPLKER